MPTTSAPADALTPSVLRFLIAEADGHDMQAMAEARARDAAKIVRALDEHRAAALLVTPLEREAQWMRDARSRHDAEVAALNPQRIIALVDLGSRDRQRQRSTDKATRDAKARRLLRMREVRRRLRGV